MKSQLERAITLAAKTGDKIIVVDELNDRSSVVMNLDEYEKLLNGENKGNREIKNLTEEELLDKINRDIVTWREANKDKTFLEELEEIEDADNDLESPCAEAAGDEDELDFNEEENNGDEIIPDFIAPGSNMEKAAPEENISADSTNSPQASSGQEKNLEENLYYYNEPEKTEAAEEESGFTSIKDELKRNKKAWEIPAEVKQAAEDVKI